LPSFRETSFVCRVCVAWQRPTDIYDGPMPYASAVSQNANGVAAATEVADAVVATLGIGADVATAFFTGTHADDAEAMAQAIRDRLLPGVLLGASAVSVVSDDREFESTPAVSLWAGSVRGAAGVRFSAYRNGDDIVIDGPAKEDLAAAHTLIVIPDPFTFPAELLVSRLAAAHPGLQVIGGMASAARRPGGNRLLLDAKVFDSGAVALVLSGATTVTTIVSQGCRPIGRPLIVTKAEGNVLYELASKPAYDQLAETIGSISSQDRALSAHGLHIGLVIDEGKLEFQQGDFLIRGVMSADPEKGTVTVGDVVPVGTAVQFQVRDALSADEELSELMTGQPADAALLFTCNGRGSHMFGTPNHDAAMISASLAGAPIGGMFCAGELGPVAGRNFLHGYTASVALFHDG
jgi:small ligand-binding sensory domain FIST